MHRIAVRERRLGHVLRRLALPHDAREVRLGPFRSRRPRASARRSHARERELRLERIAGRRRSCSSTSRYHCARASIRDRIVLPNCSSGGVVSGMLLPTD